ncbi:MAG: divergent polysaccharide deacetylase family protein [Proteobacteria bacterium]|nr:divergent polysaccharide deacetylase family protein [Pseudomonadota bacterium]
MSENRRRQIIRHLPEEWEGDDVYGATGEEDYLVYAPRERLLEKRVYLPLPVMLLGFLTIILISVTMTYLVMNWPAPGLEFAENPELARFEAAASPSTLPGRDFDPGQPLSVNAPLADLSGTGGEGISHYAGLRQSTVPDDLGRAFSPVETIPAKMPVADLSPPGHLDPIAGIPRPAQTLDPLTKSPPIKALGVKAPVVDLNPSSHLDRIPAVRTSAQTLDPLEMRGLASALGVAAPAALLSLPTQNPGKVFDQANLTSQKLMQRRYARAVAAPVLEQGGGPQLQPAAGDRLKTRTARLETAAAVGAPVVELNLEQRRLEGSYRQPVGAGLQTKKYDIRKTLALGDPAVELILAERQADYPGERETGTMLETREAMSLTAALGLDHPVALLKLPERPVTGNFKALDVPGQKLMQRRYAIAVTSPKQMDIPPTPIPGARQTPPLSLQEQVPWRRYAAAIPEDIEGKGRIVIVIDDMGNNSAMARAFGDLEGPLNFAFLPYAPNLERQTQALRGQGHELLLHLPMEPSGNEAPGPKALLTSHTEQELLAAIEWNLSRFDGFVGVNNHMGSRFTKDRERMKLVMEELKRRGLLFLDSLTVPNSEGAKLAKSLGMPWAGRDIFLDNEIDEAAILAQLRQVERIALRRGTAIAIGHPHGATLRALRLWIPTLEGKGLVLVPLSSVVAVEGLPKLASATPE